MKGRQAKRAPRRTSERAPKLKAGGAYSSAIGSEEVARVAAHASLADELLLMRAQVYLLARRIDFDDGDRGLKELRMLTDMVRTIAALERVKLLKPSREAETAIDLSRITSLLRPHESL